MTGAALDVAARHDVAELRGSSWKQEGGDVVGLDEVLCVLL